jgi:general secretion pathway protein D
MKRPTHRDGAERAGQFWTAALLAVAVLSGCTTFHVYRRAQIAEQAGDWDQAVMHYLEALAQDPGNLAYRSALLRAKISASQFHFEKAKKFSDARVLDRALVELQQAVELDPTNQYAEVELQKVRRALDAQARNQPAPETIDELKNRTRAAKAQPPMLSPRSKEAISVSFPKPISVMDIYRTLGKAYGFNVLFDPSMRDSQLAIELQDVTAEQALEIICRAAQHFYKVVDEHTILIAQDNQQNRRLYEDQVIQTFFLSNAETKDILNLLRSLVDARKIAQNEQLNAITVRDSADRVKVAESLIRANDKAKAEVVIDVELLQLNTTKLRDLGMQLSSNTITQSLDLGSKDAVLHLSDIEFLNQSNWALTIPNFIYSFIKTNGDAQLLAQPRLRISEGKSGKLTIGDKIPIPVTTFNTGSTVGGNIVPVTSFQYTDVGIKIDIEPRVHHNKEVTLKLKIEVSNVGESVQIQGGGSQPIIGTRSIESTIRLKDGETNFLAGLIRTDESGSKSGIPGLSEIPLIGRLFSREERRNQRTDLILTLTPHIVRSPDIAEEDLLPMWVGTEQNITFRGGSARLESESQGPFDAPKDDPETVREMIRRRVEGFAGAGIPGAVQTPPEEGDAQQPPAGTDLVPVAPPTDIFTPPPPPEPPKEDDGGGAAAAALRGPAEGGTSGARDGFARASIESSGAEPLVDLRLLTSSPRAWVGETVDVAILARAATPVSHWPLALRFDSRLLAFERAEAGELLQQGGEGQVLVDATTPGEILLGASQFGESSGATGTGVVAHLRFRALAPGTAEVGFLVAQALDPARAAIASLSSQGVNISVVAESPRPPRDRPTEAEPPAREAQH